MCGRDTTHRTLRAATSCLADGTKSPSLSIETPFRFPVA